MNYSPEHNEYIEDETFLNQRNSTFNHNSWTRAITIDVTENNNVIYNERDFNQDH